MKPTSKQPPERPATLGALVPTPIAHALGANFLEEPLEPVESTQSLKSPSFQFLPKRTLSMSNPLEVRIKPNHHTFTKVHLVCIAPIDWRMALTLVLRVFDFFTQPT